MYSYEIYIFDKFKDEYLSVKIIVKKRFLYFIILLFVEFI